MEKENRYPYLKRLGIYIIEVDINNLRDTILSLSRNGLIFNVVGMLLDIDLLLSKPVLDQEEVCKDLLDYFNDPLVFLNTIQNALLSVKSVNEERFSYVYNSAHALDDWSMVNTLISQNRLVKGTADFTYMTEIRAHISDKFLSKLSPDELFLLNLLDKEYTEHTGLQIEQTA